MQITGRAFPWLLVPFIIWDPKFGERKTSKQTQAFVGESEASDFPIEQKIH